MTTFQATSIGAGGGSTVIVGWVLRGDVFSQACENTSQIDGNIAYVAAYLTTTYPWALELYVEEGNT